MMNRIFHKIRGSAPPRPMQFPAKADSAHSGLVPQYAKRGRDLIAAGWNWLLEQQQIRSRSRRLHLEETISLGQKRFIALIRVDGYRLLVGGGATEMALLARLDAQEPISAVLKETAIAPAAAPVKRARKRVAKSKVGPEKCA